MTEFTPEEQQHRDELLLSLLKTPPQPRPKRDRSSRPSEDREKLSTEGTPEPSA